MTAAGIAAAYTGYPLPVIAAGVKVLAHRLDSFEKKLPVCIGIFIIIPDPGIDVPEIVKLAFFKIVRSRAKLDRRFSPLIDVFRRGLYNQFR